MQQDAVSRFEAAWNRLLADSRHADLGLRVLGIAEVHIERDLAVNTDRLDTLDDRGTGPFEHRGSLAVILHSLLLTVAFLAPGQAPAAVQAPPLPAASDVIARYVRAIGGREAVKRHASLRAVGTFAMPAQGIAGTVERLAARPDRFREKVSMSGVGEMQLGFDGSIGWMVTPMTGPMVLTGKQLEQLRRDAEFDSALHDPAGYTSLEIVDRVEFEGRPAYKLRALRTNGDEDFEFYDVDNGLLIGSIVTRESPLGTMKATNVMSDYRAFNGLQLPTRQVQRVLGTEQVITITSVEFGGVDPATFAPPASILALVK